MPKWGKTVTAGVSYHIIQRGDNHQNVFFVDDDRRAYLDLLRRRAEECGVEVFGYCLMTNHVHLVAGPDGRDSLVKAVGRTNFRYSQYINSVHKRSGHLWQGRFYSCALDEHHFWLAMKYVERNPVRAKICHEPWTYKWSSAAAHTNEKASSDILSLKPWYASVSAEQWRRELSEGIDAAELERLRLNTHTGRPLDSSRFLTKLKRLLGRGFRPLSVGRTKEAGEPRP